MLDLELTLINVTLKVVIEFLNEKLADESLTFCRCEVCVKDIAALLLNRLPGLYWTNTFEQLDFTNKSQRFSKHKEIIALTESVFPEVIKQVTDSPHH